MQIITIQAKLEPILNPEHSYSQTSHLLYHVFQQSLYHTDSVDFGDLTPDGSNPMWVGLNQVPPTPAFPVSPPTPYGKSDPVFDVCYVSL